jgi:hypothetical protein
MPFKVVKTDGDKPSIQGGPRRHLSVPHAWHTGCIREAHVGCRAARPQPDGGALSRPPTPQ